MLVKRICDGRQNTGMIYSNIFTFILSRFLRNKTLFVENKLKVDN